MLVDDIEEHDWKASNITGNEKRIRSIKAYHLCHDTWYPAIQDLTFETKFYNEIPEVLPFDKCMVRWENKSPKDSEYWGPVSTKEEVERVFYTSLRCKTNPGKIYCFRPWIKMYEEYRCFWNGTLRAVGGSIHDPLDRDMIDKILKFITEIADRIPYIRCVFDICRIRENNEMIFKIIEFNSWETLSGATSFNWYDDTDIFYDFPTEIHFRSPGFFETRPPIGINRIYRPVIKKEMPTHFLIKEGNYVLSDNFIYMSNDIWLGKFTMDFKPVCWVRGIFRFTNISLCRNIIKAGGCKYTSNLQKVGEYIVKDEQLIIPHYGAIIEIDGLRMTVSLNEYCEFVFF